MIDALLSLKDPAHSQPVISLALKRRRTSIDNGKVNGLAAALGGISNYKDKGTLPPYNPLAIYPHLQGVGFLANFVNIILGERNE